MSGRRRGGVVVMLISSAVASAVVAGCGGGSVFTERTGATVPAPAGPAASATAAGPGAAPTSDPSAAPTAPATGPGAAPTTDPNRTPPAAAPSASTPVRGGATPAPTWLGTRVLPTGVAQRTPRSLADRRIITTDRLPPPADGAFHSRVRRVPASVARRSTWRAGCPVPLSRLRYVTVSFVGFDRRPHTGELLVNAAVAGDVVRVFRRLYAARFPIEEMRVTAASELDLPSTGDGNNTSAFVCRQSRGSTAWSAHAYGEAIDVNPFQNPYTRGAVQIPELATSYLDRSDRRPGMIHVNGPVVRAFRSVGWSWGGQFRSLKDRMHFSATGR